MAKERRAHDTKESFLQAVSVWEGLKNFAEESWNEIQAIFAKESERRILVVYYDDDKRDIFEDVITSAGELAFLVADLIPEEGDRTYLKAYNADFGLVMYIDYNAIETDDDN